MAEPDARNRKVVPLKGRACPICGRLAVAAHHPFCSRRCAEADLGNWLTGHYRIPAEEEVGLDAPTDDQDDE